MTYIPPSVRRRIGLPARHYPLNGFRIRFGTDPPPLPRTYEYEISASDRRILKQAIQDANSSSTDLAFQGAVRTALLTGLRAMGPVGQVLAFGGEHLLNFLGFGVLVTMDDLGNSAGVARFTDHNSSRYSSLVVTSARAEAIGVRTVKVTGEARVLCQNNYGDQRRLEVGKYYVAPVGTTPGVNAYGQLQFNVFRPDPPNIESEEFIPDFDSRLNFSESFGWEREVDIAPNGEGKLCVKMSVYDRELNVGDLLPVNGDESVFFDRCIDPGASFDYEATLPDMGDIDFGGSLDPGLTDVTPGDITDKLMPPLRPLYPEPEEPEFPEELPEGDGPWNPGWPCNPGAGPDPDLDGPPYVPPVTPPPTGPPTIPQPGNPEVSFPECPEVFPGEEVEMDVGGKKMKGKVVSRRPSKKKDMDCDIVIEPPPYSDEYFKKNRCYKNKLAVEVMRILAVELGMDAELLIIDPECEVRFTGCFKKGTSKLDALWDMADLCGYGVIPDLDGGGEIGTLTPIPVFHGPYHEDAALGQYSGVYDPYERSYDALDMYHSVEYFRPNRPNRPGFSVVSLVDTGPFAVPEDKVEQHLAPNTMTQAQAQTAADARAREMSARGSTATFVIALNNGLKQRHQVEIRRPSRGFSIQYMVLGIRHEYEESGYVTVVEGRELGIRRYTKAPGTAGLPAPRFDKDGPLD